jgi:hypothetical protein
MEAIIQKCLEFIASAEGASATIAIVLEFAFRMIPSDKPIGLLHILAKSAKGIGSVLIKFAELSDKILPQKLK